MANLTLNGWIQSVASGVIETVPLQDLESALVLAEDFLSTQGGWVPDNPGDTTGPGVPASGISTSDAIITITVLQQERIYHADIAGVLNFRIIMNENLSSGLDDATVLTNLIDRLDEVVKANLRNTNIEFVDIPSYTGVVTNGPTTPEERRELQTIITTGGQIINAKAIALIAGRGEFNLDNTYNVQYLYTEPGKALFVVLVQYTDTLYNTEVDSAQRYGITLDPVSYRTAGGTVLPPE